MSDSRTNLLKRSRALRWSVGVFGAIFVGAIGSGLWQVVLFPALDALGGGLLDLAARVSQGFVDRTYRRVALDPSANFALLPYAAVLATVLFLPWLVLFVLLRLLSSLKRRAEALVEDSQTQEDEEEEATPEGIVIDVRRFRRGVISAGIPMAFVSSTVYLGVFFTDLHATRAATFVERSIAILAPRVEPAQVLALTAAYRSIESAADFYALHDSLQALALRSETELPEFRPLGRE